MANSITSIFTEQNCSYPYFVVTGMTLDNIISDELAVSDVKLQLHHHLIDQGFDAVIFYDPVHMIHFYDAQSSFVARNYFVPTPDQLRQAMNRRTAPQEASPQRPRTTFRHHGRRSREETPINYGPVWEMNMGQIYATQAYQCLANLLSNTHLRCAVVFSDSQALQLEGDAVLQARHKAFHAPLANRAENRNIIVIMAEADPHVPLNDILAPDSQASDWANFVDSYIIPKISSDDSTRLLRISPPNAGEIRNMFTLLRMQNGLNLDWNQFPTLCDHLAAYCSQNWVSMSTLFNLLRKWQRDNPDQDFNLDAAARLTGKREYQTARQQLAGMIGMQELKVHFERLFYLMSLTQMEEAEVSSSRLFVRNFSSSMHGHGMNIALVGNPGTGKSTTAGMIGALYREMGLLPTGKVSNTSATELTSAEVLHDRVRHSIGGILLIDEAYALMNTVAGQDVIDALVADMGTFAGQFAVVLAGYPEPTMQLLEANDGLRRRIPNIIQLPDYSSEELLQIFLKMAGRDDTVSLMELNRPESLAVLRNIFKGWVGEAGPAWGNAGEAENLLNAMKERCATQMPKRREQNRDLPEGKLVLTVQDVPGDMQTWSSSSEQNLQTAYQELDRIVGLDNVKKAIYSISRTIQLSGGGIREPGNYVFEGPPGTGKTMMAEKMGFLFQKLGVIKRRIPYIITARKLLEPPHAKRPGTFANPWANSLSDALMMSENGILFIDEAHQLADSDEGRSLLRELVPLMEESSFRQKHCIILAGYTTEMAHLFACDPGLASRFPLRNRIKFKNYTARELRGILKDMAEHDGEIPTEEFLQRTELALAKYLSVPRPNFGNARFMRNEYLEAAKEARNARIVRERLGVTSQKEALSEDQLSALAEAERHTLTGDDLPITPVNFASLAGPRDAVPEEILTPRRMTELLFDKEEVRSFIRTITERAEDGTPYGGGIHYTISGPLGCGKETIVRTIANVLAEQELIDSKEVYFYQRGDLEAGYVGQTSGKTRQAVTNAQGGTVVLVNPSAMLPNNAMDNSFGPEAIGAFLGSMQTFGSNTSFVLIDTEEGMETFLKAYPTCRNDFERHFKLEDLSIDSMQKIFRQQTADILFDDEIAPLMDDFVANWVADRGGLGTQFQSWANGDEIGTLLQRLREQWTICQGQSRKNGRNLTCPVITREMFPANLRKYIKATREEKKNVLQKMEREIGLTRVKQAIRAIEVRMRRTSPDKVFPGHYCFLGNPGVGKTRMAQKLGNVLQATNVLKQGLVIVRTAREMMEQCHSFDKIIRMARENILFIDEAHQLADTAAGFDVIKRLLTVLEDTEVMKNTCIVLAGYPREMEHLFQVDAGLRSRFDSEDNIILFDDYTAEELEELLILFGRTAPEIPQLSAEHTYDFTSAENADFLAAARRGLEHTLSQRNPNYGNARYVRNLLHDTLMAQMLRLDQAHPDGSTISPEEWAIVLPQDLPPKYRAPEQKQDRPCSLRAVPTQAILTQVPGPILQENITRRIEELQRGILLLERLDETGAVTGYGTGFIITEDGYLLTCDHVVAGASRFRARLYYPGMVGGERWFEDCTVLEPTFKDIDMALLKINNAGGFVPLPLRQPEQPIGTTEEILICGYPFGVQLRIQQDRGFVPSVFMGSVSSVQAAGTEHERVFIDCAAKSGNSGSPVISMADGMVIGMLDASTTSQSGKLMEEINYFTPIRRAWERFIQR